MTTISVPISADLENFINDMIGQGLAENKAQVIRKAIVRLAEDEAVSAVLRAEQEISEGKGLRGDLRKLAKKLGK